MKAVIELMNKEYQKRSCNIHKTQTFCHRMNQQDYKILCKDFFSKKKNVALELQLADEPQDTLQEQDIFVSWLNEE